jgi:hypothetical protein
VGIENNSGWDFKELGETMGNYRTLKRNNEERKGILIGPSMAPRFSRFGNSPLGFHQSLRVRRQRVQILRHGWHANPRKSLHRTAPETAPLRGYRVPLSPGAAGTVLARR